MISLSIFIVACSANDPLTPDYITNVKNIDSQLKASVLFKLNEWKINHPTGLVKNENQIFIGNTSNKSNVFSYNLESGEKQYLFPRGRNKNQTIHATSLSLSGNSLVTILDIHKGMLLNVPVGSPTKSNISENLPTLLPTGQQHLTAAKIGDLILATGLYEQGRYLLFSPDKNQKNYFMDYPSHPEFPNIQEYTKSILYASSVLKIHPDKQAFVCGDKYSGILDICCIRNEKIERIKQHIFHYPKVYIREKTTGYPYVAYSKGNCFGFTDISVSKDHIYAIYSGKTFRKNKNNFQQCQILIVLDWEGNITNTHYIDTPLSLIEFDMKENTIYAIGHIPTASLVKITL